MTRSALSLALGLWLITASSASAQKTKKVPTNSRLDRLVQPYLQGDEATRVALRAEYDRTYRPLERESDLRRIRERLAKLLAAHGGRRLETSGTHYFFDPEKKRGKYIVRGARADTLFIGLHGGGVGSGDAEGMAAGMGGGGWVWIFPEVLEKTERGWVDSGTEEFVLELVEAAKRTFPIDPNKIYVSGHSMGGHGSWSLGAHHPDLFAGAAAYAGGPTPFYRSRTDHTIVDIEDGLLPNLYSQTFLCFQSSDDPRVPPEPNDYAFERLKEWKARYPEGFNYRYLRVDDRGHNRPAEGYLPTQQWVAEHTRNARPKKFLWQPTLEWKKHFYWIYWPSPILKSLMEVAVTEPNRIDVRLLEGGDDPGPFSLFLGAPLVDLDEEIAVFVQGEERFRGRVEKRLSTLLWTLPWNDADRLFEARIDIGGSDQ